MSDVADPRRRLPRWARIVLWVAGGLVALVVLAIAFVAISIAVDSGGSAARLDAVANTQIPGGVDGDVAAYVATPDGPGPFPTVIMVHEFWGLNEDITEKADLLSEQGYLVVAPDVMGGRSTGWLPTAIYQTASHDPALANEDLDAVVEWLGSQPEVDASRTAIVGFCFGGRAAMLYSLHNPTLSGTVVFYGNPPLDEARLRAIQGPVLGIFGGADASIPLADVEAFEAALDAAGLDATITVYEGQGHAFVASVEAIEAGGAPGEAWDEMSAFLEDVLDAPADAGAAAPQPATDPLEWSYIARLGWSHLTMEHDH